MTAITGQTIGTVGNRAVSAIFRDIVRGGLAGVIAGAVVGGVGGRLAMRLAFLAFPGTAGSLTSNGNQIGAITLEGTLGLVLFGAFGGLFVGAIWVALSPWIPWTGVRRALATMPLAIALGTVVLIDGQNPDFVVLRHSPLVVSILLLLIGAVGLVVALADGWLDGRLPRVEGASFGVIAAYASMAVTATIVMVPSVLAVMFAGDRPRILLGLALVVAGGATVAWWRMRLHGQDRPPRNLVLVGRTALVAIAVLGIVDLAPDVIEALGAG